jgi:hypothetical protein
MNIHVPAAAVLARRFLTDYRRSPANVLFLVLVPVVFVVVAADTMADAAQLLGGTGGGSGIAVATAGWAAGFLAGVAMYFQVSAARHADRRLVLAGLPAHRLVTARLGAGAALALLATAAALLALTTQGGIDDAGRVAVGTLMFAVVYLGLGAIVGAVVSNPVNGTVLLMLVWIVDVFLGPALSASTSTVTRLLPTHFVSLWTVDAPSGHGGPAELTWAVLWIAAALAAAFAVTARTATGGRRRPRSAIPGSARSQLAAAVSMALREWRRTPVLAVLLAVVPAVFIWLSDLVTPHGHTPVTVREDGRSLVAMLDPADIHAGTMAPIAVGSLAALAGIFIALDSQAADRRLVLAGQRPGVVLATRLGTIGLAAGVATVVALLVASTVFQPRQWGVYVLGNVLVAVTYGLVGVVLGRVFGRVSGTFLAFLVPFLDLGIGQSPMLAGEPPSWAQYLPGFGSTRILIDGALTDGFDEAVRLLPSLGWLAGLLLVALAVFGHRTATTTIMGRRGTPPTRSTGWRGAAVTEPAMKVR